jgi:hypothetical protein
MQSEKTDTAATSFKGRAKFSIRFCFETMDSSMDYCSDRVETTAWAHTHARLINTTYVGINILSNYAMWESLFPAFLSLRRVAFQATQVYERIPQSD